MKWLIKGVTHTGMVFRPSDWNFRLASVLAHYRSGDTLYTNDEAYNHKMQGYSNYIMPQDIDDVKCILLDDNLLKIEPRAWDFVLNFARDNNLLVIENYPTELVSEY